VRSSQDFPVVTMEAMSSGRSRGAKCRVLGCTSRLQLRSGKTSVWLVGSFGHLHESIFTSMHAPHLACHIPHQPTSSYLRSHCYVLEDMQVHPSLFSQATRIEDFASSTTTRRRSVRSPCLGRFFWQASSVRIDRHTHSVP
jgi:hypothetical protein